MLTSILFKGYGKSTVQCIQYQFFFTILIKSPSKILKK